MFNNPTLTLADFASLQLTFDDSSERHIYSTRSTELSRLAKLACKDGDLSKAKALHVLADICSVWWRDSFSCFANHFEKINTHFDRATHEAIAEYCKADDLDFWLQARLAEFAYMRQPRTDFASIALQAYAAAPLTWETWYSGGSTFWLRALELEGVRGVTPTTPTIKARLLEAALNPPDGTPYQFTAQLATSFFNHKIEVSKEELNHLSTALDTCITSCSNEVSDFQAAELCELLSKWHQKMQNMNEHAQFCYKAANAYIRAANAHPDSGAAARIYENAISSLLAIPSQYRGAWNECSEVMFPVETLITRLKRIITQEKQLGFDGMQKFSFSIRIPKQTTDAVAATAKQLVSKKSLHEAFIGLATVDLIPIVGDIRQRSIEGLTDAVLPHIGSQLTLTSTGNINAIAPPVSGVIDDSSALNKAMVENLVHTCSSLRFAVISQALEIIRTEHPKTTLEDCVNFCTVCCVAIPSKQRKQWGAALFAGYRGDWISALLLIAPLLEGLIRFVLLTNTGQTGTLKDNKDGTHNEISLNKLLPKPEMTILLGEDTVFALDALFCNGFEPNLRNAVAHGLVDDSLCESAIVIYAWWLAFCVASQLTLKSNEAMGEQP
jgi:Domain of unknown function (DUF4209)